MAYKSNFSVNGTLIEHDVQRMKVRRSISDNNSVGTAEIFMENTNGRNKTAFSIGDDVVISIQSQPDGNDSAFVWTFPITFSSATVIFSGTISEVIFTGKGSVKEELILRCRDYTSILQDSTIQPILYQNTEYSAIVTNIISNNITGVTTNNVNVTPYTKTAIRYNHQPVFDAIKDLATESNFFFYVDENKDLHFQEKGTVSSILRFDTTNITKGSFKTVDRGIANNVWVYGNRRLTGWENEYTADCDRDWETSFRDVCGIKP